MSDDRRERRPGDGPFQEEEPIARLYQQTKEEAPPSHLDAAVLTAARRAVEPTPRASRAYFLLSRKWAVPLSLAAALLVSLGVVREFHKDIASPVLSTSPSSSPALPESILRSKELDEETNPALLPEKKKRENATEQERGEPTGNPSSPMSTPPVIEERSRARGIRAGTPHEEQPVADVEKPAAPVGARQALVSTESIRGDDQSASAPATLGALLKKDESDASAAAKSAPQLEKGQFTLEPSPPQNAPGIGEQKSVDVLKEKVLSPEDWIRKINELRRAGKVTEAEESLKKFKERYPEYPVEKFLEQPTTSSP